ncbi:DUF523 domain-containing protein [Desulfobotulus sp.]|uniref:DUF523 domain-containing protein n=1 Tax=Desulfobotulus sp. TaxID=1940337 RepID=UPI002A36E6A1|nr:DUF523 domain-containing protein [Desulfobotulus sp.]MDY0162831.1 DUF523 domain-containing protein [Desulfobotulus sp.]
MNKILMSACLLGEKVRYNGEALFFSDSIVSRWISEGRVVPVCPEVGAGMCIPRKPAEIFGGDGRAVLRGVAVVIERDGTDVTDFFVRGAHMALNLCQKLNIRFAVLTESSPSCGSTTIYDGSFSGKKIRGMGVVAALLTEHGIQVFSQHSIPDAERLIRRQISESTP